LNITFVIILNKFQLNFQLFTFCVSAFFLASADLVTLSAISSTSFFAISSLELVFDDGAF
jgi:hypothetical protein